MAEVANAAKPQALLGHTRLAGRIESVVQSNTSEGRRFRTLLRLPAADAFTSPATVEVRSTERLGGAGDEVSVVVRVGGYSRHYKTSEGEARKTADNILTVVQVGA